MDYILFVETEGYAGEMAWDIKARGNSKQELLKHPGFDWAKRFDKTYIICKQIE